MAIPWLTIGAGLYLGGQYAWTHWINPPPPRQPPQKDLGLPRLDEGANIPLIYGKCRVRSPIIAWIGTPHFFDAADYFDSGDITGIATGDMYACSMYLVLGIPFPGGTQKLHRMWAGELPVTKFVKFGLEGLVEMDELTGEGSYEVDVRRCMVSTKSGDFGSFTHGEIEFLNGDSDQHLVNQTTPFAPTTAAGEWMTVNTGNAPNDVQGDVPGGSLPGYRGFLSVFLFNRYGNTVHWALGPTPHIPQFSFECSSYPRFDRQLVFYDRIGAEANPAAVIYDIVLSDFAKLGIPSDRVDIQSFINAGVTLYQEAHGYSRAVEEDRTAEDLLGEILTQIAGVLYEDNSTGLLTIKLLRNDYDPSTAFHVTKHNCRGVRPSATGWTDVVNKVRVRFPNRSKDYQWDSVTAQNLANIVAGGNKVREVVIDMPGVCTPELAQAIADRELAALSRPMQALRLEMHRDAVDLKFGEAIKVTLTDPDISGIIFRVVGIDHGTLDDGTITLEVVQDNYYVFRGRFPEPATPPIPPIDPRFTLGPG